MYPVADCPSKVSPWLPLVAGALFLVAALPAPVGAVSCERARLDCAYREGCAHALHHYMRHCDPRSLRRDAAPHCPQECQYALTALTSTPEGKRLMTCVCNDNQCRETKLRLDVCRPHVARLGNATEVPCRLATQICSADQQCYTALEYYRRLCQAMFSGRKCTARCRNSIAILRRQDNAARLAGCSCDGTEDFDCSAIQDNMSRLCFHKHQKSTPSPTTSTQAPTAPSRNDEHNEIGGSPADRSRLAWTAAVAVSIPWLVLFYCR